jgi:hypothetical protein
MIRLDLEDSADDGCDTIDGHDPAITAMLVKVLHESLGFQQFPEIVARHRTEIVAACIIVGAQVQLQESGIPATQEHVTELVDAAARAWWMWARIAMAKEGIMETEP